MKFEKQPTVRLMIRIRKPAGEYRYCNPVWQRPKSSKAQPKLKPLYAVVDGAEEYHERGRYALRYVENGKRRYENVGSNAEVAQLKFERKQRIEAAKEKGVEVIEDGVPTTVKNVKTAMKELLQETQQTVVRRPFNQNVKEYIDETKTFKLHKTFLAYRLTLEGFKVTCQKLSPDDPELEKLTLEDLERKHVMAFITDLKGMGCSKRTVRNRVDFLKTFFFHFEMSWPLESKNMPKYTEKMVLVYTDEQVASIMQEATADEFELLQFFLCTGGREQDVASARWSNIGFSTKKFYIEEDTEIEYTPKDKEEAAIPIPDALIDLLRARKARSGSPFIFPAQNGKPNGHLLRIVKRIALRAGLNCGSCCSKSKKTGKLQCCDKHPVCKEWTLHKWRKTFATMHHRNAVPARQIQKWLRHSDLETTLKYLACADDECPETRRQVNSTFAPFERKPSLVPKSA